jgi:hypothetical protein
MLTCLKMEPVGLATKDKNGMRRELEHVKEI